MRSRWRRPLLLISVLTPLSLGACANYQSFLDGLEKRNVQSCVSWQGGLAAGSLGVGGQGGVRAFTMTGGATIETCSQARNEGLF